MSIDSSLIDMKRVDHVSCFIDVKEIETELHVSLTVTKIETERHVSLTVTEIETFH